MVAALWASQDAFVSGIKLVYIFLVASGPQSFTSIRRCLGIGTRTVDRAVRELLAHGFVELDDSYLYSVNYFSELVQQRLNP